VTASDTLPSHCECQHLTKFVLGLWLRGPWTQAQLLEFQLALLVEFMHRARVPLELTHKTVITPAQWVDSRLQPPDGRALLRHATVADAWRAWAPEVAAAVALVSPGDIVSDVAVTKEVFRAAHFQFTYSSISFVFRALWTLSGHGPYRFDVRTPELVSLLRTAAIRDNAARIKDPNFMVPVDDVELYRMAASHAMRPFRAEALETARGLLAGAYATASAAVHGAGHPPTLFLPDYVRRFEGVYRADLRGRYAVQANGLSGVACCIPTCPHFLVPLASSPAQDALHPRLRDHLESVGVVPGLHKVCRAIRRGRTVGAFTDKRLCGRPCRCCGT
jgi:hypothetical protein